MNRGDRRKPIFKDDFDRRRFRETLGKACAMAWNLNYRTNGGTLQTFTVDGKNQLTSDPGGFTDTYDGNGNPTNRYSVMAAPYDYSYDDENQMTSAQRVTLWRTEFVYDGKGRMRKRLEYTWSGSAWTLSTAVNYVYDGMRVIQERSSSNVPQVSYTRGTDLSGSLEGAGGIGGLLGRSHAYQTGSGNFTNHNFYQADGNGNVTYMLNSVQSRVAEYRYDPFGNTISSSGTLSAANVYRFSSKEIHANSGMYYYGFRFYDPNLQRWLNRDPLGEEGGINLYEFVRNSPANYADPLGLQWQNWPPTAKPPSSVPDPDLDKAKKWLSKCAPACRGYPIISSPGLPGGYGTAMFPYVIVIDRPAHRDTEDLIATIGHECMHKLSGGRGLLGPLGLYGHAIIDQFSGTHDWMGDQGENALRKAYRKDPEGKCCK